MSTSLTTSEDYRQASTEELVGDIKKASAKARSKGLQMIGHMQEAGRMLIELKERCTHGTFMAQAVSATGIEQRTINRYMQMARGEIPHRTVEKNERGARKDRTINLIRATEFLPGDDEAKMDTAVSILPDSSPPPPAPKPKPAPVIIDAEFVDDVPAPAPAPAPVPAPDTNDDVVTQIRKPEPTNDEVWTQALEVIPKLTKEQRQELYEILARKWDCIAHISQPSTGGTANQ